MKSNGSIPAGVTCGLTAKKSGFAPSPTLVIEYGTILYFSTVTSCNFTSFFCVCVDRTELPQTYCLRSFQTRGERAHCAYGIVKQDGTESHPALLIRLSTWALCAVRISACIVLYCIERVNCMRVAPGSNRLEIISTSVVWLVSDRRKCYSVQQTWCQRSVARRSPVIYARSAQKYSRTWAAPLTDVSKPIDWSHEVTRLIQWIVEW